jgi:phosphoribosylformylglycinamidine synthase subunit PurQ / glutaminase
MKTGIIRFPGSNCDRDIAEILKKYYSHQVEFLWHKESFENKFDLVVLPGGFSYGDYLRCGALAKFSLAMKSLKAHIDSGRMVMGICNGFQILTESGLLPGALTKNKSLQHICKNISLMKGSDNNSLTKNISPTETFTIPISHGEGCYFADADTLKKLNDENRILFRYAGENPNGSLENIAGITSKDFKIFGLMPHPERAVESISGSTDGKVLMDSFFNLA